MIQSKFIQSKLLGILILVVGLVVIATSIAIPISNAQGEATLQLETVDLPAVSGAWQTANLINTYQSPVIACSITLSDASNPAVVRLDNVGSDSFDIKLQNPGDLETLSANPVSCLVAEEGAWTLPNGSLMEAKLASSASVSHASSWVAESRTFDQAYSAPVIFGQVMSHNNSDWSSFWSQGSSRSTAPSSTDFKIGIHVGSDTNQTRATETIGYIVVEENSGTINGADYQFFLGDDSIQGVNAASPSTYALPSQLSSAPVSAVVSQAGMDGTDGSWAALYGPLPLSTSSIDLVADEDQIGDAERVHTTEQVSVFVYTQAIHLGNGTPPTPPELMLETQEVSAVDGNWKTVSLINTYQSPVIACAPANRNNASPIVVRLNNVSGASFDIKLQSPGDLTVPLAEDISCLIVEEGTWTLPDGSPIEAKTSPSTVTSNKSSWVGQDRPYSGSFSSPAVFGQVMSHNNSEWSVFWSQGDIRSNAATSSTLKIGMHVGGDSNTSRTEETLGYIIIEEHAAQLNGVSYQVFSGADSIKSLLGTTPSSYSLSPAFSSIPTGAIVTQSGMDGTDGSWATLYGQNWVTTDTINLIVDEDQIEDAERAHTTEQVSVIVYASSLYIGSEPPPTPTPVPTATPSAPLQLETHVLAGVDANWQSVNLINTYVSPVIVCTPNLNINSGPIVVRLKDITQTSFSIKLQSPGETAPIVSDPASCLVVEEGVWSLPDGRMIEAHTLNSPEASHLGSWVGESRSYSQAYAEPVVLGQVMGYQNPEWSVFWAGGSARTLPPDSTHLQVGIHVGEDTNQDRLTEEIGYVVFESGFSLLDGTEYQAFAGSDTIKGVTSISPSTYSFPDAFSETPLSALASQAGNIGGSPSWSVLFGPNPVSATEIDLVADEDQIADAERAHIGERVGVLAFGDNLHIGDGIPPTPTPVPTPAADHDGTLLNHLDIAFDNPTWSGNPFDLVASVTFTHAGSGLQRQTEMFYNDGNEWKARFTGEELGWWTYTTTSGDSDLNGLTGTINITDSSAEGFVIADGDKWVRSGSGRAFVPQFAMYKEPIYVQNDLPQIQADVANFIGDHGFTGLHIKVLCRWFDINEDNCGDLPTNDPNPDFETFETIEAIILETYAAGGTVHIWVWGDEMRNQTPQRFGYNGAVDQRLQRYIAARLGPIPGWTMGYGFDVWEYADASELDPWHAYMQSHMGWPHLLGARSQKNQINQLSEVMDYSGYEQHRPDYDTYVLTIQDRPTKPSFSEDRFRVEVPMKAKDYTLDDTRRGLWHSGMAGGIANIWGYLLDGGSDVVGSATYPNKDELKINGDFMRGHFHGDMERCNTLTADSVCLKLPTSDHYIFYKEDTATLQLDLSSMTGSQPYLAINTITGAEVAGTFSPQSQTWTAPESSDWVIAVGDYCAIDPDNPYLSCGSPPATATPMPTVTATGTSPPGPTETPTETATPTVPSTPTLTATPVQTATPVSCGPLMQEAEDGTLAGLMQIGESIDANEGEFVHVPENTLDRFTFFAGNPDYVSFCFNVIEAGEYKILARVAASGDLTLSDSFFVQVDDQPADAYVWDITFSDVFVNDYVSDRGGPNQLIFDLDAGQHVVKVYLREDGSMLDTIELEPHDPNGGGDGVPIIASFNSTNGAPLGQSIVTMHQGYMFVPSGKDSGQPGGGFSFYDMSVPASPVLINSKFDSETQPLREAHAVGIHDDVFVLQSTDGVMFWDMSDVLNPTLLDHMDLPDIQQADYGGSWWLHWQAPYLYVATLNNGLYIVNASDPSNPVLVNRKTTGDLGLAPRGVFVIGNLMVLTQDVRVRTYDITDPAEPVQLDFVNTRSAYSWMMHGDLVLGVGPASNLIIVDISDPTDISQLADAEILGGPGGYLNVQDDVAHVGASDQYTKVDISDPSNPIVLAQGSSAIPGRDEDFATAWGNLVFVGNDHENGSVILQHDPAPDTLGPSVARVNPPSNAISVSAGSRIGLSMSDLIDPATLNSGNITIRPIVNGLPGFPITGSYSHQFGLVNFAPDSPLAVNTTYEIYLPAGGLKDVSGNGIEADFVSRFSTGSTVVEPGGIPPVISDIAVAESLPAEINQSLTFSVTATGDAAPLEYFWELGDGTVIDWATNTSSVNHTYSTAGNYSILVRVRDAEGDLAAGSLGVSIINPLPANRPTQSSQLALDHGRRQIWAVNPDNDTVTVIHADTLSVVEELASCQNPTSIAVNSTADQMWVTCRDSDALQIYNAADRSVVASENFAYGSEPISIVFAPDGSAAYIAFYGTGLVNKLDPTSRTILDSATLGATPHTLAVTGDGANLLVSRFISADGGGTVWQVDTSNFGSITDISLPIDTTTTDSDSAARGVPNYLAGIAIDPQNQQAWVAGKKDNILRGGFLDGNPLTFETTVRAQLSSLDLSTSSEVTPLRIDVNNHAQPAAATYSPYGNHLFLAMQGNNRLIVLDPSTGVEIARADTGRAPQSILIDPATNRVFSKNFMSRSVTVLDGSTLLTQGSGSLNLLAQILTVQSEQLPATVLQGKQLFYDAADSRLAADGYMSCASCHINGEHDGRTWDMTSMGEGLRNTTSLRGHGLGTELLHWTGNFDEVQDFEAQIRDLAGGSGLMADADFNQGTRNQPLGDPKAGLSSDLDALAAYVTSLSEAGRSPYRNNDGSMTALAQTGQAVFETAGCATCHGGSDFVDSDGERFDVGTAGTGSGNRLGEPLDGFDPPSLRGLWNSAPYLHNGSAVTLQNVLNNSNHVSATLSISDQDALIAYLLEIDDAEVPDPLPPTSTPIPTETPTFTSTPLGTETPTLTPTATQGACGPLAQEAEDGILVGLMQVGTGNGASENEFITVPNGLRENYNGPLNSLDWAEYCVDITVSGTYQINAWVASEDGSNLDDSFYVQVDDLPASGYLWDSAQSNTFIFDQVSDRNNADPVLVDLFVGQHWLKVHLRENGTRLDRFELELVNDPSPTLTPTPTLEPSPTPPGTNTPTATPVTSSDIFYVSRNGDNTTGQGWAQAWNELDQVDWNVVEPGDTIFIDGGTAEMTYTTSLTPTMSGTQSDPILIQLSAEPGRSGKAIFFGGNTVPLPECGELNWDSSEHAVAGKSAIIFQNGISNIVIDGRKRAGITIHGWSQDGIVFLPDQSNNGVDNNPSNVTLRYMEIYNNGDVQLTADGSTQNIYLPDDASSGIELAGVGHTFEYLEVHDNAADAIQSTFTNPAGNVFNNMDDITIRNSWFYNQRPHSGTDNSPAEEVCSLIEPMGCDELGAPHMSFDYQNYPASPANRVESFNWCTHPDGVQIYSGDDLNNLQIENSIMGPNLMTALILGDVSPPTVSAWVNNLTLKDVLITRFMHNALGMNNPPGSAGENWQIENVTMYGHFSNTQKKSLGIDSDAAVTEHTVKDTIMVFGATDFATPHNIDFVNNCEFALYSDTIGGINVDPDFTNILPADVFESDLSVDFATVFLDDYTVQEPQCAGRGSGLTSVSELLSGFVDAP